jgi:hypothetical protein
MAAPIGNPYASRLGGLLAALTVRPRVFISYHHHGDQMYYDVLTKAFADQHELIHDASLEREINSEDVDYVSWRIRDEYIRGTSCTVVLCGADTPKRKYVDWEVSDTLDMEHGLVAIALPYARRDTTGILVPSRVFDNLDSGYAVWVPDWASLTPQSFAAHIADARQRAQQQRHLIRNARPLMRGNE